ncbi:MAG: hypothetical protein M1815_004556 [Lichina confinis]|nr:MAG: hypothetical protein M1815_004556 [Lichina confinis]
MEDDQVGSELGGGPSKRTVVERVTQRATGDPEDSWGRDGQRGWKAQGGVVGGRADIRSGARARARATTGAGASARARERGREREGPKREPTRARASETIRFAHRATHDRCGKPLWFLLPVAPNALVHRPSSSSSSSLVVAGWINAMPGTGSRPERCRLYFVGTE